MNTLRFRSGQTQLFKLRVDSGTVIEAGDLVYLDGNGVKPAGNFPWTTDLETTQTAFCTLFLGVAWQASPDGETEDVSVDLSPHSIYEYDVASGTFEVGGLLGPDELSSTLRNQQLASVASTAAAIARAAEYKAAAATSLRVMFASAFHTGSANANASVG